MYNTPRPEAVPHMEYAAFCILVVAALTAAAGWVWFLIAAFRHGWGWGIGALLFPPVALVYIPLRYARYDGPFALLLLAGALAGEALGLGYYERLTMFRERDRLIEGERHLTLTGWDKRNYAVLRDCRDVAQLYMANKDVTDDTLKYLEGMHQLKVLDLDNTRITDAGLAVLARLPALTKLRLRNTAVTDAGFRQHLMGLPNLKEVTVPRPPVSPDGVKDGTLRKWKKEQPERLWN